MVGMANGSLIFAPTINPVKKTPAQAGAVFTVPSDLPTDYTPPEYRSIAGLARIGLDIETVDPDIKALGPGAHRKDGKVVGVAIAYSVEDGDYYPTSHDIGENVPDPENFYKTLAEEAKVFEGEIVGANLQYDLDWLRARHNVQFPKAKFRDVQLAEGLLDENRLSYKLNILAKDHLNKTKTDEDLRLMYGGGYISNMNMVHPAHAAVYAVGDVTLPWEIMDVQEKLLADDGLTELFDLESRLLPLLLEMRSRGVRIDLEKAQESYESLTTEYERLKGEINEVGKANVDIWSADSIAIAYENLGIPYNKTKAKKPSFTKDFFNKSNERISKLIVEARECHKTAETFIKSYILDSHCDERIHCMFHQLKGDEGGAATGRFSSSNPNLQNIPARHPVNGPLMRSMFIPEEGMLWGSLDWSQIEYRLLVHYAHITLGVDASDAVRMYREDPKTDYHDMASTLTGLPRKYAKNVNFGVVYGMGPPKFAASIEKTITEGEAILEQFHEKSPYIKQMLDRCSGAAASRGFIKTILGRKRRFDTWEVKHVVDGDVVSSYVDTADLEDFKKDKTIRGRVRRAFTHKALNALLQGSAADLMKKAMVEMWEAGLFEVLIPHLTVHDEFNSSVPDTTEGHAAFAKMREIMETTLTLEVPVLADGNLGKTWDEAK